MSAESEKQFREIVDTGWTVDGEDVYAGRLVVDRGEAVLDRSPDLVKFVLKLCGPFELGDVFNMDDFAKSCEPDSANI